MQCSACGFANPEGGSFCGSCGGALSRACVSCGRSNPAEFRFCGYCGTPLPELAAGEAEHPPAGGRRQITVMFCDLVNSTGLATEMDPEELHEVIQAYHVACEGVITREGGYVAQHLGDGTMSYFGWPVAAEDAATGAVRAGLAVLDQVVELNQRFCARIRASLGVRVGIHTGVVVVGEVGVGVRAEHLALGTVPNVAARLQSMAQAGSVLVSEATHRLIAEEFECEPLGARPIRGMDRTLEVYRVLGERAAGTGDAALARAAAPLVGREEELALLAGRWEGARAGGGQAVVLTGEAGIGKSHLVRAYLAGLDAEAFRLVEIRCQSHYRSSPYFPVIDYLRRELVRTPDSELRDRVRQLLAALEWRGRAGEAPRGAAQQAKERTRDALVALLLEAAERHPLIMVVEDLHWSDPSTVELLQLLLRPLADARALLLVTIRPDARIPLPDLDHLTRVAVGPLPAGLVQQLVARVAGQALPDEVVRQIVEKTDGVPLFVEELTKMVMESGMLRAVDGVLQLTGPLPPLAIPATLQDSLQARLDRLTSIKEIAQVGAVIGREFGYPLLKAVAEVDEAVLQRALTRLVDAELIQERGTPPDATYTFRHALIHDIAYQGMLRGTRQRYHARIGQALAHDFPQVSALHPEILAQHFGAAGLPLEAADHWLRAAAQSLEQSAPREALTQLHEAQNSIEALPASVDRERREARLYATMGPALVATSGYMSSEVREVYQRAYELANAVSDARGSFLARVGLFASHFVHGEMAEAERLAHEALAAAEGEDAFENALRRVPADAAMGCVLLELGRVAEAHVHLRGAVDRYDPLLHAPLMYLTGQDFGVLTRGYDAYALWTLGYPDQALASARSALELARELDHPHTVGLALYCAVAVHQLRREPEEAVPLLEELGAVAERGRFVHWAYQAELYGAWAECRLGDTRRGLERLRLAVAAMPQHGAARQVFACERLLAEALVDAGEAEAALEFLRPVGTELWFGSETVRLRARVLALRPGAEALAEGTYLQAREIARVQHARMLELRAAAGLAELLARQGRGAEGIAQLAPLLATFTEGEALDDLREARALASPVTAVTL